MFSETYLILTHFLNWFFSLFKKSISNGQVVEVFGETDQHPGEIIYYLDNKKITCFVCSEHVAIGLWFSAPSLKNWVVDIAGGGSIDLSTISAYFINSDNKLMRGFDPAWIGIPIGSTFINVETDDIIKYKKDEPIVLIN